MAAATTAKKAAQGRIPADIRRAEEVTGLERSTIWRYYRAGTFPAPFYIGERRHWWLDELEAWRAQQIARPAKHRKSPRNLTPAAKQRTPAKRRNRTSSAA
jgi:predicted DNA-binding transcriptional regulator AlpA